MDMHKDMDMHMDMDMQHKNGHAAWTWTCKMDMDMQHGHAHALSGHRSTVLSGSWNFFFHFCHPSRVQAADDGRPGLLLHINFKGYMTAAVFTSRTMQKRRLHEIFRHLWRYLEALLHFSEGVKIPRPPCIYIFAMCHIQIKYNYNMVLK